MFSSLVAGIVALIFGGQTLGASPIASYQRNLIPFTDSEYYLGTTTPSTQAWKSVITDEVCLTGDTCRSSWPAGGAGSGLATTSPVSGSDLLYYSSTGAGSAKGVATTSVSCSGSVSCSAFTAIGSAPVTISASGGGTGTVSTSTNETAGRVPYWTTTSGTPAKLGEVATSSVTINAPLTSAGTAGYVLGGSGWTLDIANIKAADLDLTDITLADFTNDAGFLTTVDISANTNLATTYPLILTNDTLSIAFGTTTSNTWANTQTFTNSPVFTALTGGLVASNASSDTIYNTGTTTLAGTANQVSVSNSPVVLGSAGAVLTLPNHVIFPASFQSPSASTTNATSTNLEVTGLLTFNGVTASTWAAFCQTITGSADLCDGSDATGGSASWPFTPDTNYAQSVQSTTTALWLRGSPVSLAASSTAMFDVINADIINARTSIAFYNSGSLDFYSDDGQTGLGGLFFSGASLFHIADQDEGAIFDISQILTTDKTFTFPNFDGSFALGSYHTGFTNGDVPFGSSGLLATSSALSFNNSASRLTTTYASTTVLSGDGLCIGSDCRTSWPTAGGSSAYEIATTSDIAVSQVAYISKTGGRTTLASVATTTPTLGSEFSYTGTLGKLIGGADGTLSLSTGGVALTKLATQAANTVLVNQTSGAASPTALATSTFANTLYSGTAGQVLARLSDGTWAGVATTTFSGGLTYSGGNVTADLGTSVDISAETNLGVTYPITLTGDTVGFDGISTSSAPTQGNLPYWTGSKTLGTVATTTLTLTSFPANLSGTLGKLVGGADTSWTWWGLATTSAITQSHLLYSSGANGVTSVATSTRTYSGPFTSSGTLGAQVGGTNSVITWTGLATTTQPASSNLLVSNGGAGVYPVATSSLTLPSTAPFNPSGTLGALVGGANFSLGYYGLSTSSAIANTEVIYGTAANTVDSEAALAYNATDDRLTLTYASTTGVSGSYASTSDLVASLSVNLFGGGAKTTANALCIQLTGSADLCDGSDASGAGGGGVGTVSTSTTPTQGGLSYWTSSGAWPETLGTVSTTTLSLSGPFTTSATLGTLVGGSNSTINWTGLSTTSAITQSHLFYSSGGAGVTSVATSTRTYSGPFTNSGTLGAQVGGTNSVITWTGLATTSNLTQSNVLYNTTGGNGVESVATTSLSFTGPFTIANAIGVLKNGAVTYTGLATTSAITQSHVLYSSGGAGVTSVATSSLSLSGPFTPTTFGAFVGGSNATLGWYGLATTSAIASKDVLFASSASGVTSDASNFVYDTTRDALGIGTSTPWFPVNIASSSKAQIALSDGSTGNNAWTLRSVAGSFYLATSSPTTFATSTAPALSIDLNGAVTFVRGIFSDILRAPYSASPTVATNGDVGIDSTSNQFKYYSGSAVRVVSPTRDLGFAYATTTWNATTTLRIGPAPAAITFSGAYCETNTGTVGVSLYDGTNRADYIPTASTTINRNAYTTNNTFTAGETIRVDVGTPASSPTTVSCRFLYTYDAD